jgi:hypothetical protein
MALQSSGQISAAEIRTEFGATNGTEVRFGSYRVSQTISGLTNMPLDNGIPQSGEIKFSNFYTKKLNVVVDYTVGVGTTTRVTARTDYDANNTKIVVIGNFRQRPTSPAATKVWIHTNGDVGSDIKTNTREYCSLRTGTWDSTTDLQLDIGPSGRVVGAGGDGGAGGKVLYNGDLSQGTGSNGNNGTSAIGINTNSILVTNRGLIRLGGGGGGGGGAAAGYYDRQEFFNNKYYHAIAGGSGGGGGIGYPAGIGGAGGTVDDNYNDNDSSSAIAGNAGNNGSITSGGDGGVGSNRVTNRQVAASGGGGGGGSTTGLGGVSGSGGSEAGAPGTDSTISQGGSGGTGNGVGPDYGNESGGGTGGSSGYAIIVNNVGTAVTITNTGTIVGSIVYSTSPL